MASRYTTIKPLQRCLSPVTVYRNGLRFSVPCGRCSACLLDKSNSWAQRLSAEIDAHPYSIFFTLTYDNKYLPKLQKCYSEALDGSGNKGLVYYTSNNRYNIRFDSVDDVERDDNILIAIPEDSFIPTIKNWPLDDCFGYASKRDIQLWLKLLRKDIYKFFDLENANEKDREEYRFRYFIISEYGPTPPTHRAHYHGIIFPRRSDQASFLVEHSLYANWKMCDKSLFQDYVSYCNSGASTYVTQYITCPDNLPQVLKEGSIKPFRLASKAPAIGFVAFDRSEVFEALFTGSIEYNRSVRRLQDEYVLPYPAPYMARLFPKCKGFGVLSSLRLHHIYGFLWRNVVKRGFPFDVVYRFISKTWDPVDVYASKACYDFCITHYNVPPCVYEYLFDLYYYKKSMLALKRFYEWQEKHIEDTPYYCMQMYTNFSDYYINYESCGSSMKISSSIDQRSLCTFEYFCRSFGFSVKEVLMRFKLDDSTPPEEIQKFSLECDSIIDSALKLPKFNDNNGFSVGV